jgi:hypothetical protein
LERHSPSARARAGAEAEPALKARAAGRRQAQVVDFRLPVAAPPEGAARLCMEVRGWGKGALRSGSGLRSAFVRRVAASEGGRSAGRGGTSLGLGLSITATAARTGKGGVCSLAATA